ncbi:hypothetical protein FIBSPDRAFT_877444 [Athelia psychrophila]|uniref:Uncharacterized protein n=1 Tax=Athelia psychrophila TaxID=1759441 RepID=A0A167VYP8_9AGAM|nr:hypothetical protein FIBSPDRAFT_877444 [Fibularhizoctonia sp. CBS 109695]
MFRGMHTDKFHHRCAPPSQTISYEDRKIWILTGLPGAGECSRPGQTRQQRERPAGSSIPPEPTRTARAVPNNSSGQLVVGFDSIGAKSGKWNRAGHHRSRRAVLVTLRLH